MKMMTKMIVLRMRRRKVLFGHPENQADLGEDQLESPNVHIVDTFYVYLTLTTLINILVTFGQIRLAIMH